MSTGRLEYSIGHIMDEKNLDAIIVTDQYSMRYIASYRGEGVVVYSRTGRYVITDSRYTEQVERECPDYHCVDIAGKGYVKCIREALDVCAGKGYIRAGFENYSISFRQYAEYSDGLENVELVGVDGALDALREVKTEEEIEKLRTAESIGDEAFTHILGYLKPGITEREVALELEYYMKKNGAEGLSFDTIAASGRNSSMPHAIPTDKKLEDGDFLTMDFGCLYEGYCSDMTRTVAIGHASDSMRTVYETVLMAQTESMKMIKAGVPCNEVDAVARRIIADKGYGNCFGHGLGHSVGLFIHENPRFSPKCTDVLKTGMVITVEPGIYLPGQFGVRIEDLVVVTENGFVNLTSSEKKLIVV